jgi:hypothetical protein
VGQLQERLVERANYMFHFILCCMCKVYTLGGSRDCLQPILVHHRLLSF